MTETLRTVCLFVGIANVITLALLAFRPLLELLADEETAAYWRTPKPSNVVEFRHRQSLSSAALGKAVGER